MKATARRNVTFALPTSLLRSLKVTAARQGKSMNALVTESLDKVVQQEGYEEVVERILSKRFRFSSKPLKRSEIYG